MALGNDPLTDLLSTLTGAAGDLVDRVVINTRYGPSIVVGGPKADESPVWVPPAERSAVRLPTLSKVLKPEILVYVKGREKPLVTYAPHGAPGATEWPWLRLVALFGAATVGFFTWRGVTRPR